MKNSDDNNYLYVRQIYTPANYVNKGKVKITTEDKILYLYFDKNKHMNFTENFKFASVFYSKPYNYEKYVEYIKKKYPNSKVEMTWEVAIKKRY